MKGLFIGLIFIAGSGLFADTVSWRTFTGWDHGYTITIDGEASKITLVEHLSRKEDKKPVVREMPRSKTFVAYVSNLIKIIPGETVGPQADDGRVIFVSAKKGNEVVKKEILMIDLYLDPKYLTSVDKSPEKVDEAHVKKVTEKMVAEFKVLAEAYMLQQMMFDLKARYFDRFKLDDSWVKPGDDEGPSKRDER